MYQVATDEEHAIVKFMLTGRVDVPEVERFCEELAAATATFSGRQIKIQADLRGFQPISSDVARRIREVQEYGLSIGVMRVAEIIEGRAVAMQLNAVARLSKAYQFMRRFAKPEPAREWLLSGHIPAEDAEQELRLAQTDEIRKRAEAESS